MVVSFGFKRKRGKKGKERKSFSVYVPQPTSRGCRNVVIDYVTGDMICADTGEVLGERLPMVTALYNSERVSDRPVGKVPSSRHGMVSNYSYTNPKLVNEIAKAYAKGASVKDIMARFDIPSGLVYEVVDSVGIRRRKGHYKTYRRVIRTERSEIINEYRRGLSIYAIAKKHKRSTSLIHRILRSAGLIKK